MLAIVSDVAKDCNIDSSELMKVMHSEYAYMLPSGSQMLILAQESVEPAKQLSESVEPAAKIPKVSQLSPVAQQILGAVMAAVGKAGGRYVFFPNMLLGKVQINTHTHIFFDMGVAIGTVTRRKMTYGGRP